MVHDYFKVDWDIVYTTARDDLPALKPRIEAILAALSPDPAMSHALGMRASTAGPASDYFRGSLPAD